MIRYIRNYRTNYRWYKENKDTYSAVLAPNIELKVVGFCWSRGKPIFEVKNFGLKYERVYDYRTVIEDKSKSQDISRITSHWLLQPV